MATNAAAALPIWQNVLRLVAGARDGMDQITGADVFALDAAIINSDATLDYDGVLETITYDTSVTEFDGTWGGNDTITGTSGNDHIEVFSGDDEVDAGAGNDLIYDRGGSDIYHYGLGYGDEWIQEYLNGGIDVNVIEVGSGITTSDVYFERLGDDLFITVSLSGTTGTIIVDRHFSNDTSAGGIEKLVFADTSEIDIRTLDFTLNGLDIAETLYGGMYNNNGNDTIYGNGGNDRIEGRNGEDTIYGGDGDDTIYGHGNASETDANTLYGGAGNDYLQGSDGDDILQGDSRNDTLIGGDGDDSFYYNAGDGFDTLSMADSAGTTDNIYFGSDIVESDLSYIRVGSYDLKILLNGGLTGSLYIQNQFGGLTGGGEISDLILYDTTVIDLSTLDYRLIGTAASEILTGTDPGVTSGNDTIFGEGGNDIIKGKAGADELHGGDGNDTIYADETSGSTETDRDDLYGDAGDDTLYGDYGDDHLYGGADDDTLRGSSGDDSYYFFRGEGHDTIEEKYSGTDTLYLGSTIAASNVSFYRVGRYDLVVSINDGFGGTITLSNQHNTSSSYAPLEYVVLADTTQIDLFAQSYTLYGTASNDTLYGAKANSTGEDTIYGGDGNHIIYAYDGSYTETTANWLYGEAGNDTLWGGYGDDTFAGGLGDDLLTGRFGDDIYLFNHGDGDDEIDEDGGTDDNILRLGAGITVNDITYDTSTRYDLKVIIDGGAGGSIYIDNQFNSDSVEWLVLDDETTIDLLYQAYDFTGTSGTDYIHGRDIAGALDTLYGYDGNDVLYGYDGDDIFYGGAGTDTVYAEDGDDTLYGEADNDTLRGQNGNDTLYGGDGNDTLYGDNGDDILSGGLGDDNIQGGNNTDTVDYSTSATAVTVHLETHVVTGKGTDTLNSIENATGSDYDDILITDNTTNYIDGGDGSDTLDYSLTHYNAKTITINLANGTTTGTGTSDTFINIENVIGRQGADSITGNSVANILKGWDGNDTIDGATGDDLLYGQAGADTLTGGDDADTFVFESASAYGAVDTITDFDTSEGDVLDICVDEGRDSVLCPRHARKSWPIAASV